MRWLCWGTLPLLLLIGCSKNPVASVPEPEFDFSHWKKLAKLNDAPLYSESHKAYIDIYANPSGKKAYESMTRRYPVGAEILKPLYSDKEGKHMSKLTIMVKMPPGYDSDNGDWWYGVYDNSGSKALFTGRIESCIKCHKIASQTDYLFADSVMEEIVFFKDIKAE